MIGYGCLKPLIFLLLKESSTLKPCIKMVKNCGITYLEINDNEGHDNCSEQIAKIWSILSVDSLLDSIKLVWLSQQEMEESNDSTLEFSSLISSNSNWGERFPEDSLTDVGGDEKRNSRSESISLLKELIKHKYHESSEEKLGNDEA